MQAALEVRKPQYAAYDGRTGLFDNLIAAYLGIDPGGYADSVLQAMDYLDKEVPNEPIAIATCCWPGGTSSAWSWTASTRRWSGR